MTFESFYKSIQKLKNFYGEKALANERIELVRRAFDLLTDADFEIVCEDIIANENHSPTMKIFNKYGDSILHTRRKEHEKAVDRELEQQIEDCLYCAKKHVKGCDVCKCRYCDNTGQVEAFKRYCNESRSMIFTCPGKECISAKKFSRANRWTDVLIEEYEPWFRSDPRNRNQVWKDSQGEKWERMDIPESVEDQIKMFKDILRKGPLKDLEKVIFSE